MQTCVARASSVSEMVACPPTPVAVNPSAPPSSITSSPHLEGYSSCLFTPCQPVCAIWYYTTVLFKVLYSRIKNVLVFVCFLMYYLCEKHYRPIIVQYYMADCISWVPRLALLGLSNWTHESALWTELTHVADLYCRRNRIHTLLPFSS